MPLRSIMLFRFLLAGAIAGAEAASAQDDAGDYIHYRLGVKYKQERNYEQALGEFRKVLAAYPDHYNAYLHIAEIHRAQQQYQLAIYDLKRALTYNPGWGRAHRMLAEVYEANGQLPKAIEELQICQQLCDPAERDSLQAEIDRLVAKSTGRNQRSTGSSDAPATRPGAQRFDARQGGNGGVSAAHAARAEEEFRLGVELYGQKKYGEALERMRACLALDRGHGGAYYYGGLIRRRWGQNDKAKFNFLKALSYPDLGYNAHFYLGKIYGEEGNCAKAVEHLTLYVKATGFKEGQREASELIRKYQSGCAGLKTEEVLAQVDSAREKMQLEAGDAVAGSETTTPMEVRIDSLLSMVVIDTLTDRGQALLEGVRLFQQRKFDQAITGFKKAQIAYPGDAEVMAACSYNMGVCYFKLRLFAKAENQFQQVLDRRPSHRLAPACLFFKALSYAERKESATAEKLLRAFIQQHRQHAWAGKAYEKLGDAYLDLEQPKSAADAFAQAAAQARDAGDRVAAWYKLGAAYAVVGNQQRSDDAFLKAIDAGESGGVYLRVPDAYYKIADALYQRKEYTKALDLYTTVTRKYSKFQETPWGLFQIGNIRRNLKQYREAIDAYKNLIASFPEDYWARQAQWKMEDTIWEYEYQAVLH